MVNLFPKSKSKAKFDRPEGAGNFDNMDDVNVVQSISLRQGTIQHTPANAKDIVNKAYADSVGGGGALDDLSDVTITAAATGDILRHNGTVWVDYPDSNFAASSHTHALAAGATDVTSTAAEVNILDGATLSVTELNYVDGVTSAIQTQMDLKAPLASPTFTGTVTIPTPFTLGAVSVLPTGTELNFVDGVTSAIQTQIDNKVFNNAVDEAVGFTLTGDNSSADTAYVPMVLYNTDATPPAASGFPIGTLYIQYTA